MDDIDAFLDAVDASDLRFHCDERQQTRGEHVEVRVHTCEKGRRSFLPDDVVQRCGPPTQDIFPASQLGWCFDGTRPAGGMDNKDRAVLQACRMMRSSGAAAGISEATITTAGRLFRIVLDSPVMAHVRRTGIVEGCVYCATRMTGAPRTPHEIAQAFQVELTIVRKGAQRVVDILVSGRPDCERMQKPTAPTPQDFVPRFVSRVPGNFERHGLMARLAASYAHHLLRVQAFEDMAPHDVAAVAIVLALEHTGRAGSFRSAHVASGVALSTIKRVYKATSAHRSAIVTAVADDVMGPSSSSRSSIVAWAGKC